MIIEIVKPYKKWKPGDKVDVTNELGAQLCFMGIAKLHGSQIRFDSPPKKEQADEVEPQSVTINNYYLNDDAEGDSDEQPKSKTKKDFQITKK
jgi:hypothetical protein